MVEDVEQRGIAPSLSPGVVWFLSFNLGTIVNIIYAVYLLYQNNTWNAFVGEGDGLHLFPLKCLVMATTWMIHVHLYGAAQAFMGSSGAYIAWPLLMICTVITGQIWSIYMGEWNYATDTAINRYLVSLTCLLLSSVLVAYGGSV